MSKQVDERVVRMQFDNEQFERKMSKTMSSLQKFEAQLQFKGATEGLKTIQKAADKVDMSHLENVADKVELKFSTMSAVVIHQVNRMVDSVVDAGVKMAKSLTFDQVTSGFDKYTQKTAAVQTIMNATGKSVEDVGNALEKLQWFSDETSYSFVDMTNNVGKFTSAGVDLNVAVSAMQGIANAAADAGSNSTEASRAMYNFAQALAKGYVQLIDWKSIENANMATLTFKNTIVETALELGTLKKAADGTITTLKGNEVSATNFNDALKDAWFTNDVLLKSLGKYSAYSDRIYEVSDAFDTCAQAMAATSEEGAELGVRAFKAAQQAKTFTEAIDATKDAVSSGWMRTFEIIFGNFNESVELWTAFTNSLWDIFASGAEGRNEVLKGGLMSGWNKLVEKGVADTNRLKEALIEVGAASDENLKQMIEDAGGFEKSLVNGWVTVDILGDSINNIVDEIMTLDEAQLKAKGYTQASIESFLSLKAAIDNGTISLEEFAEEMSRPSGRENLIAAVANAFKGLQSVIEPIRNAISELFPPITAKTIYNMTVSIRQFTEQLKLSEAAAYTLKVAVKALLLPIKAVFTLIKIGFAWGATFAIIIFKLVDAFLSLLATTNVVEIALRKVFGDERYVRLASSWAKITNGLGNAFNNLGTYIMYGLGWLIEKGGPKVLSVLKAIYRFFEPAINWILNAIVDVSEKIANFKFSNITNGIKTVFGYLLEKFPFLKTGFDKASEAVRAFFKWFEGKTVIDVLDFLLDKIKGLLGVVTSLFSAIDWAGIWSMISNGATTAGEALKTFGGYISGFINKLTPAKVLTYAFGAALIWMLFNVSGVMRSASWLFDVLATSTKRLVRAFVPSQYTAIAASILVLTGALVVLSLIDSDKLWNTVAVLGIVAGGLLVFAAALTGLSKWVTSGQTKAKGALKSVAEITALLLAVSGSLVLVAIAFKKMPPISNIGQVLASFAVVIAMLSALMGVIVWQARANKDYNVGVKTIIAVAAGLYLMTKTLEKLIGFDQVELLTALMGLIVCVGALRLLFSGGKVISKDQKVVGGMLSFVAGLLLFVLALKAFANLDFMTYLSGLLKMIPVMVTMKLLMTNIKWLSGNVQTSLGELLGMAAFLLAAKVVIEGLEDISWGSVAKGLVVIGGIGALLSLIMSQIQVYNKEKQGVVKAGSTFLAMSVAIGLMCVAIWALGKIDLPSLAKGTVAVTVLIGMLSLFMLATKGANKAAGSLATLTLVIAAIATTIALFTLLDWKELWSATAAMTVAMIGLATALAVMGKADWKKSVGSAASMVVVITALTIALTVLKKIDWKSVLASGGSLALVVVAIGTAIGLMNGVNFESGIRKAGSMLLFVATAVGALLALGKWNKGATSTQTLANAAALSLCVLAISKAVKIMTSTKTGSKDVGALVASIIAMIAFLAEVGVAIGWIASSTSEIDGLKIIEISASLSLAVIAMSEAVKIMSKVKVNSSNFGDLFKMAVTIGLLLFEIAGIFKVLAWLDVEPSIGSAAALGIAILALSGAIRLMGNVKVDASVLSAGGSILMVLAGLALVFYVLNDMDYEQAKHNITALGIILAALTVFVIAFNYLDISVKKVGSGALALDLVMLMVVGVISLIGGIMNTWDGLDYALDKGVEILEKLQDLIPILLTFTLMSTVLEVVGLAAQKIGGSAALAGVDAGLGFDAIIALISALILGIGGLMSIPGVQEVADKGFDFFERLGEAIGSFFGNIIGKFVENSTSGLEGAANNISEFVNTIAPAMETMGSDEMSKAITSISDLVGAVAKLTAADFVNSLNVFSTDDPLGELGKQLVGFADPLKEFLSSMDGITVDQSTIDTAIAAAKGLADVASEINVMTEFDLGSLSMRWTDITDFAEALPDITSSLIEFLTGLDGVSVDSSKVNTAVNAAKGLAGISKELAITDINWGSLSVHRTTISEFADDLPELGRNLKRFQNNLGENFDSKFVKSASNAAKSLASVASTLPIQDIDWVALSIHRTTIGEFADDLPELGRNMRRYQKNLGDGFDSGFVMNSASAVQALADVANGMYREGGIASFLVGSKVTLSELGTGVIDIGTAIKSFSNSMGEVDQTNLDSGVTAINTFSEIAKVLAGSSGWWDKLIGSDSSSVLEKFGSSMKKIGAKLKSFYEYISEIKPSKLDAAMKSIRDFYEIFKGVQDVNYDGMDPFNTFLKQLSNTSLSGISEAFNSYSIGEDVRKLLDRAATYLTSESTIEGMKTNVLRFLLNMFAKVKNDSITNSEFTNIIKEMITNQFLTSDMSVESGVVANSITYAFIAALDTGSSTIDSKIKEIFGSIPDSIKSSLGIKDGSSADMITVGEAIFNGVLLGLDDSRAVTIQVGVIISTLLGEFNSQLRITNNSSAVFEDVGEYIIQGIIKGLEKHNPELKKSMIKISRGLLDVAQETLEIHSPSRVFRDEVGRWIVEGIVEGLEKSSSAEDAARTLAQNISGAFSDALSSLSITDTRENLEYELWETLNPDATDVEKNFKKAEMLESQISRQSERVSAANAEWKSMIQVFGEDSTEAQEAYNRYLQAQLDMAKIASQINDLRTSSLKEAQDAINEYYSYGNHDLDALLNAGTSVEEAWKMAAKDLGYDVEALEKAKNKTSSVADIFAQNMVDDVEVAIETPMGSLEDFIKSAIAASVAKGVTKGLSDGDLSEADIMKALESSGGLNVAEALAKAFGKDVDDIDMSSYTAGSFDFSGFSVDLPDVDRELADPLAGIEDMFSGGFSSILDNIVGGASSWLDKLGITGSESAKSFLTKFCEFLGIHSPSVVMEEQGEYIDDGLAIGINKNSRKVDLATAKMAADAVRSFATSFENSVNEVMISNSDFIGASMSTAIQRASAMVEASDIGQPVIRPVLDLSEVEKGIRGFSIGKTMALDVMSIDRQITANKVAKQQLQNGSEKQPATASTVYNFNQTNTSPKALNASEIYRQSKNLFSQLKNK